MGPMSQGPNLNGEKCGAEAIALAAQILHQVDRQPYVPANHTQIPLLLSSLWENSWVSMHIGRRTIIKTLKELGAVRLANALAK